MHIWRAIYLSTVYFISFCFEGDAFEERCVDVNNETLLSTCLFLRLMVYLCVFICWFMGNFMDRIFHTSILRMNWTKMNFGLLNFFMLLFTSFLKSLESKAILKLSALFFVIWLVSMKPNHEATHFYRMWTIDLSILLSFFFLFLVRKIICQNYDKNNIKCLCISVLPYYINKFRSFQYKNLKIF